MLLCPSVHIPPVIQGCWLALLRIASGDRFHVAEFFCYRRLQVVLADPSHSPDDTLVSEDAECWRDPYLHLNHQLLHVQEGVLSNAIHACISPCMTGIDTFEIQTQKR